ncbi:hypothetical protein EV179_000484 [Coemansia sp. RSA 487]|nr:hypothetical protein EV179_000484 [Coemansia sp. RSA 487]
MPVNDLPQSNSEHGLCISASRHSGEHTPALSPTRYTSLRMPKHRGRDAWRQSLQQNNVQPRCPSSPPPRPRSTTHQLLRTRGYPGGAVGVSSSMHDSFPPRLSLDSQRTAISSSYGGSPAESRSNSIGSSLRNSVAESCMEHMGGEPTAAPMWSDEQLRRARRFSSSHIRGVSCPTLNITRIMRSISVSSINASGRVPHRSLRHEPLSPTTKTRFHSQQQLATSSKSPDPVCSGPIPTLSTSRDHKKPYSDMAEAAAARILNQDVTTSMEGDDTYENICSNCSDIENDSDNALSWQATEDQQISYSSTTATDFAALSNANAPTILAEQSQDRSIGSEGLRRRISARHRDIGTPDISILEEEEEEEYLDDEREQKEEVLLLENADSATRGEGTIAEALRNLESVERHSDINALSATSHQLLSTFSSSEQPGSETGGETMTITLKGPHKRESTDTAQQSGDDQSADDAQYASGPKKSCDSSLSAGGDNVAIPAIYLDSTASLWDQYVAELQASDFDPNIHLKRQRMSQFLRVPWNVEKLLWFGVAICIDALLYVFSILPAKFACAAVKLGVSVVYDMPVLLENIFLSSLLQTTLRLMPISWSRRLTRVGLYAHRWLVRVSGRNTGVPKDGNSNNGITASGHMGRWLSPMQLFDFYRGLLFIITCVILCRIDAAQMYHGIRAQGSLKLYFIFSTLDIFDRLLSSFGHDALDALQSTVTDAWNQRWKTGPTYFVLAQAYMLMHTLVLFYQMITLHVAVNSYSDQLLALLISNQFVEIKSNVFKKWEKEMLFQISCADIVERFQEIVFLFLIILRNLAELSGSGSSSLFDSTTSASTAASGGAANLLPPAQLPVSFDKATPSAFGPLIPSWVSMPVVNRILTPILMVLGSEILIDWIKHSFITKLNWIRPEIYSHYIGILSRDLACPKTGSRVSIKLPPELGDVEQNVSFAPGSDADEKIARSSSDLHTSSMDTKRRFSASAPRSRSSSVLTHAALRVLEWMRGDDEAEDQKPNEDSENHINKSCNRRRGHQRTHSVTKPQLFVEQSTRVSRRLGLSPMPLACLIILVLMQVVHILVWPPRTHHVSTSALGAGVAAASDSSSVVQTTPGISLWIAEQIAGVPIFGTLGGIVARACGWTIERVVLKGISAAAYAIMHPQKAVVSVLSVVFLDVVGWMVIGVVAYAIVVWIKLGFGSRLMDFAWGQYREFEKRTSESNGTSSLKQFDDDTRKLDRDAFAEVGKLVNKDESEMEWEKQRPKWTLDNIERFSLFKSRIQ